MNKKSYHHGNLRAKLIETGIEIVNKEGAEACSLRKVAAKCSVSHAAPYSHFEDKEELFEAMKQYVTDKFVNTLNDAIQRCPLATKVPMYLGKAYICFFAENPNYFQFLFSQSSFHIDLTSQFDKIESYQPFEIFKNIIVSNMNKMNIPKPIQRQTLLAMWSTVHGMAAIVTMKGVDFDDDWEAMIEKILSENLVVPMDSNWQGENSE